MIHLFRHLRETGNLRAYFGVLFKRHRAILAYVLLTLALVYVVDSSNDAAVRRVEQTVIARCEAVNDFRRNTNTQFDHFVKHNNAAIRVYSAVGDTLNDPRTPPRFREVGKQFQDAATEYKKLARHFHHVPLEDCEEAANAVDSPERGG